MQRKKGKKRRKGTLSGGRSSTPFALTEKEMTLLKNVILSADNELKVYLVPDFVAGSFSRLCADFSMDRVTLQIHDRSGSGFDETDFIEYLNEKICKDEKCVFVEKLGWDYNRKKWPEKYRDCPHFNF